MRLIFLMFTLFVLASAYRRYSGGGYRRALHVHQLRGDNLRNHYQRHHSYEDTDDDSDEYLYDSNDNSDNNSYEDSDDGTYYDSAKGMDTFRNERGQQEPHFVSCFGPRRPNGYGRQMDIDFDKKSDDNSAENSDDVAYENSQDGIPFKQRPDRNIQNNLRPVPGIRYTYRRRQ